MEFEPKIFRTIIFVRHGQYSSEPEKLTQLGRKQAQLAAKALTALRPSKIACSTMPRAMETASIIGKAIGLEFKSHDMFRESLLPGTGHFNKLVSKKLSAKEKKTFFAKTTAERWLKMDIGHASLTTIRISKSGGVMLLGFADVGHLPVKLRTYV